MKKLFSALLALVMIVSLLSVTAFAANISTTDDHTYKVYQIFTGDLAEDGQTLSNIKWGANAKLPTGVAIGGLVPAEVLAELAAVNSSTDDQVKLAVIEKYVDLETNAIDTVTSADAASVANGYYLLKDLGVSDGKGGYSVPDGQEYSEYVTKIVNDVTISPKKGETTTEKKLGEGEAENITWKDADDHSIGDVIPFQLKATITENYDNYETYYFAFHDEQSAGLTFNADSVKVYVDDDEITSGFTVVANPSDGCTFEIVFADLKAIAAVEAGSVITATYTSTLNSSAVIGSEGNPNTMYGEYSNNPNDESTGTTTPDTVVVFTFEFKANKVAKNPDYNPDDTSSKEFIPLAGAGFTLYKQTGMTEATDGTAAEPIWTKIGDEITGNTTFSWKGLESGTYKLEESTTPSGYNTMEAIIFTITATYEGTTIGTLECTESDFSASDETGIVEGDIENVKGTILPETGGIGTTIFYVLGGILLVGAAVLLITKKRMGVER